MVAAERPQSMTAEEFFAFASLPENRDRRLELEDGEIVEMAPAATCCRALRCRSGSASRHSFATTRSFALRLRGLAAVSSASAVIGLRVTSRTLA